MSTMNQLGKYQPYPDYKDSRVEWLGKIPKNWSTCAVWMRFYLGRGRVISNEEIQDNLGVYPVYSSQTLNEGVMGYIDTYDFNGDYITWTTDGANAGTVFTRAGKFNCTNVCGTLSASDPLKTNLRFYTYALSVASSWFVRHDINPKLMNNVMAGIRIPSLSPNEQSTISAFLDYETARIDQLIAKQQQLIELLKEKRQAVISHAVTKGLNPNAPMKDSGVEWLGQVPEHWEAVRVKQVSTFITSGPRGWSDFIVDDGDEIFLQSGDLNNQLGIDFDKAKKVLPPKNAEGVRTKLNNGDVLVCITGANTGRVAVANNIQNGVYINQHLSLIRPKTTKIESYYLGLCLSSSVGRSFFDVVQYGLKEGLSLGNISEAPLALPPKNEQSLIISYIENINHRFSLLSNSACKQVELLKERRTALISAAVTGKIDLRGWQPPKSEVAA